MTNRCIDFYVGGIQLELPPGIPEDITPKSISALFIEEPKPEETLAQDEVFKELEVDTILPGMIEIWKVRGAKRRRELFRYTCVVVTFWQRERCNAKKVLDALRQFKAIEQVNAWLKLLEDGK